MGLFPPLQPTLPCVQKPRTDCLSDIPELSRLSIHFYDKHRASLSMETTLKFPVYVVYYHIFFKDPHVAHVEYHTVLFVDTSSPTAALPRGDEAVNLLGKLPEASSGSLGDGPGGDPGPGIVFHVQGDITSRSGMYFASKAGKPPRSSETYHSHRLLGYTPCWAIEKGVFCRVLATRTESPLQQKAYNAERRATEPFKSLDPLVFYTDEEYGRMAWGTLKKCAEWVWWEAVPVLIQEGLLETVPSLSVKQAAGRS